MTPIQQRLRKAVENSAPFDGRLRSLLSDALAEIERLSDAPSPKPSASSALWQPIETAPRDGTVVLGNTGCLPSGVGMIEWANDRWCACDGDGAVWEGSDERGGLKDAWPTPSHWLPLPEPPVARREVMARKDERRPTTGAYSDKTPGLPNTDPKRADQKLRDFSAQADSGTARHINPIPKR